MKPKNLLEQLAGGDRRSIGRSDEVVARVLKHPERFADLVRGLEAEDPLVRMRAADAAEKATVERPELLRPFKADLLRLLEEAQEQELRWHLAQMVPRLALTRAELLQAADALKSYLKDNSSIVKTFALQALAELAVADEALSAEVKGLLQDSLKHGTAAMKARARKLLPQLERSPSIPQSVSASRPPRRRRESAKSS